MQYIKTITLDISNNLINIIDAKQGDTLSRFIDFNLIHNNMPVNLINHQVKIYAEKPDGTKIFNNVEIRDATNGKIRAELTNQFLAVPGKVKTEIAIYGNDGSLFTTKSFIINVIESVRNEEAIESSNEFNALTKAISDIEEAIGSAEQLQDLHQDVIDAKNIQPILHQDVIDANSLYINLEQAIQTGTINEIQSNIGNINNLQTTNKTNLVNATNEVLTIANSKAPTSHTHTKAQITDFSHTHTKANITDFTHTHNINEITNLFNNIPRTVKIEKSNKDSNGIYTQVDYKREDNTLFMRSVLSGGASPQYTTRTITIYDTDGSTVIQTITHTLTYDADGNLISEL